ncbi:c-type cytochrome [Haliea sp. E17]|uniref:c-type cytochrome n=1 Tax=Haliea sp. E17 TaxID=3401576 RepID=UPI003AAE4107
MTSKITRGLSLSLLLVTCQLVAAEGAEKPTPPPGAVVCFSCHGSDGISSSGLWPNLAGQKPAYLVKQMKDFQSGARKDPMMSPMAKSLNEEQITAIADYFANL